MTHKAMTHPDTEHLVQFGLGRLGELDSLRIEQHLPECADCTSIVADVPADGIVTLIRARGADAAGRLSRLRLHAGYEILEELGRGGMGIVYKARQHGTNRLVALKRLSQGTAAGTEDLSRFRREAEAAGRLQHPNIVRVYDFGEQDGHPYLAMEYVEGESLAKLLSRSQPDARGAAQLIETLARAVHHAHQNGIAHRDLKPANILLASAGCEPHGSVALPGGSHPPLAHAIPKITDFGLAKRLDVAGQTQTGNIVGTPSYMAPEQASGTKEVGPAADIYALGAILYELLTGRPPFRSAATLETLEQVRTQEPVAPSRLVPRVSRDVETICLKCLRKEPGLRYSSAESLADDLRRFQAGEAIRARRASRSERAIKWCRRKPAAALAIIMAGLTVLGAVGGLVWHNSRLQSEVERAENGEAAARRQKAQALANFVLGHDALDEMALNLSAENDVRSRGLRHEQAKVTLRYYDEAFKDADRSDPDMRLLRAINLTYGAYLETVLDHYPVAIQKYQEAIALLEGLIAEQPNKAEYQRELGFCLSRYGFSLTERGAYLEAEGALTRALDLLLHLPAPDTDAARTQWLLGFCYLRLAKVESLTRKAREAEEFRRRGVAVWRAIVENNPHSSRYRLHLGEVLRELGNELILQDKQDDLVKVTRESIAVLLPFRDAHGVDYYSTLGRYLLGHAYFQSARLECHHHNDRQQSRADATRGIQVIEELLKEDPRSANARACAYSLYRCRAYVTPRIEDQLGDWDRALAAADGDLQHGCRIERAQAYAAAGKHAQIAEESRSISQDPKASANQLFAIAASFGACVSFVENPAFAKESKEGRLKEAYAAEALACLRRCQAAGGLRDERKVAELKSWPAFGSLRARSDFQDWLRQLE